VIVGIATRTSLIAAMAQRPATARPG